MKEEITMKEAIKCINGHLNPDDAQYCGICGAPITRDKGYTPDLYPNIHFVPVSVKKIKFLKGFEVFSLIVFPICIIAELLLLEGVDFVDIWEEVFLLEVFIPLSIATLLFAIGTICGLKHLVNCILFKRNADYIEETTSELVRIAKHGKLGLFNQTRRRLLLKPGYERVDKFDSKHVLIGYKRFAGLYSVPRKQVIIPVQCDTIYPEKDGIIEVTITGRIHHFDVYGNKLY